MTHDPLVHDPAQPRETAHVAIVLEGKPRELGGFSVRRVLPSIHRRRVGPFVFFDHMGPFSIAPGRLVDVRPHPHIGLATVTYLFEGEIVHRDSLGSKQTIVPGDVNWMTSGRGIVHSERTDPAAVARGGTAHGLQCWVGLPKSDEECDPTFTHYPSASIPSTTLSGVPVRVVIGAAYGVASPVRVASPTLFVEAVLDSAATLDPPRAQELAVYVVSGAARCDDISFGPGTMLVFRDDARPPLHADAPTRLVFVGGEPLDGERHVYWNFVSSDKARIEQAKTDWKERRFPIVPGDEHDFIPLPS
jgi:redox-sensitive bicupin YhaK (pirin superfamily)